MFYSATCTLILSICLLMSACLQAQGEFAGTMKKLLGEKYTDDRDIPALKGWQHHQGSVMTELDEPEAVLSSIFRKGTTQIVFFSIQAKPGVEEYTITDVLEVKNVPKGYELKTSLCRHNQQGDVWIVALVKPNVNQEYWKAMKAWRYHREQKKFEVLNAREVDCYFEGYEQF